MILSKKKVLANFVPAAAVIRKGLALFGFIWCKKCVGGFKKFRLKFNFCYNV